MVPPWMAMAADVARSIEARRTPRRSVVRAATKGAGDGRRAHRCGGRCASASWVLVSTTPRHRKASPRPTRRAQRPCSPRARRCSACSPRTGLAGYVIDRLWPKASVYEYGESISLGTRVFDDYVRIAGGCDHEPDRLAAAQRQRHHSGALLARAADRPARHTPGWTLVADDNGMLLYLRGDASLGDARIASALPSLSD